MSIKSKEFLPKADLVTEEGDVVPSYTGEVNGPRNFRGALVEELDEFDDPLSDSYDGTVPPDMMPLDSTEYKIWAATEKAKARIAREAGNRVLTPEVELPSDDARSMYQPFVPSTSAQGSIATHPSSRGKSARTRTPAMRNARQAEDKARSDRWDR